MIVADNGSNWYVSGAPHPKWSNDQLHTLHRVPGSAFEVVDGTTLRPVGSGRAAAPRPDRAPAGAVLHLAARARVAVAARRASRWSTSGAATRTCRRRRTWSRRSSTPARERTAAVHGYRALRRAARAAKRRSRRATPASTASSSTRSARSRSCRGRRRRSSSSRSCSRSAATGSLLPDPGLSRTTTPPSRSRAPSASRSRSTRPAARSGTRRRRARRALVYLNYPSNPSAVAAPDGRLRRGGRLRRADRRGDRPRLRLRRPRLRRPAAGELPRRAGRARGRRRDLLALEELRHGRLAARVRRRQRRARRAA